MAKLSSSLSLCLWLWFLVLGSCLASRDQPLENECQLEQLESLEPDNVIKSEAGRTETWNPNHKQFRCVGVALSRCTLEHQALKMPSYTNSPHLIYIRRGRGIFGVVFPGCANTVEEPQESESGKSRRSRDRHQKIEHFRQGDIIAVPAGIAYWMYNSENEPVEAISLLDTSSYHNQLDRIPRRFYLAGNQKQEFLQYQEERQQQQQQKQQQGGRGQKEPQRSRREGQEGPRGQQEEQEQQEQQQQDRRGRQQEQEQEQEQQGGNIISGFEEDIVAQTFNVDKETARKLRGENNQREGSIIRVRGGLSVLTPPSRRQQQRQPQEEEEEEEDEDEKQQQRERQQERRRGGSGGERESENALEETLCTLRLSQNIGKSTSPDIYHPQAGSLRTVNSLDLPVLRLIRLGAEFGSIHKNAIYVPHYNMNANSILYALEGKAQVQVVDCSGNSVYNQELKEGQALTVPQNYAVAIKSQSKHFLYVAFKTNDKAMVATLPGLIQAWPEEVVAQAYQLNGEQARELKNNSPVNFLVPPQESQDEMRAVA